MVYRYILNIKDLKNKIKSEQHPIGRIVFRFQSIFLGGLKMKSIHIPYTFS